MPEETSIAEVIIDSYGARLMALRELRDYTQHLVGDVLTIVDASIADPQQNKALKRLIKNAVWEQHYTRAMEWADRQVHTERRAGVPTQNSAEIDALLGAYSADTYNPFPFSVSPLPSANDITS